MNCTYHKTCQSRLAFGDAENGCSRKDEETCSSASDFYSWYQAEHVERAPKPIPVFAEEVAVMKGRTPTVAEKELHNAIANQGCIACRKDGVFNDLVSIHHIAGRTRPDAHRRVLPLCAGHHQDGTGNDKTMIAVHPFKARFEQRYGSQYDLLAEVMGMIGVAA